MWCPSCAEIIKWLLLQEKGVINCVVDYATDLASIEYSPLHRSKESLLALIKKLGYSASLLQDKEKRKVSRSLYLRLTVSIFCALNIMMFSYPLYAYDLWGGSLEDARLFAWISLFISLPALFFGAWPIFRRFFTSLRVGVFGMETLVVLGITTSFGLSLHNILRGTVHVYFDSMTTIIVFVLLGKIIETKAKFSAREALLRLSRSLPRKGRKIQSDGTERFVSVKEIQCGDHLTVLAGEKVVLDGQVIKGEGACDESLITGEAIPVFKKQKSAVVSGSILKSGRVVIEVTKNEEQSTLKTIIKLIEQDLAHKTPYVRAVDSIIRWFVPAILLIAFSTALTLWAFFEATSEQAVVRAISILLISCPCAIGIAAPLAESLLMNSLAGIGVIVRNRGILPLIGKESAFVFDKTGTLTEGLFKVKDGLEGVSSDQAARLKGLAMQSNHPISTAIAQSIPGNGIAPEQAEEVPGKGIKSETKRALGSKAFMKLLQITVPLKEKNPDSNSTVFYAENQKLLAKITLSDSLKKGALTTIQALKPTKTILLSGDAKEPVESVAKKCSFSSYHYEKSPLEKREFIEELKQSGEIVCMMGDGINDAPALTAAQIGISVVSATDISIHVSDILLTTERFNVILELKKQAKKGQRIISQNLFWAFFYNSIGIVLAVTGFLLPLFAALAMVLSSLIVIFNALRLKGK